jgi:hypothetical protein
MGPQPIANNGTPFANIDKSLVNASGANYAGGFNSLSQMNHQYGLVGVSNNAAAANASKMVGGRNRKHKNTKQIRRKIKNIANSYKMRKGNRVNFRSMKKRLTKFFSLNKRRRNRASRSRKMRGGGYHQFGSNIPATPSFSVGGQLGASNLGMANPPPINMKSNIGNCTDNYNHNTNKGFQFW